MAHLQEQAELVGEELAKFERDRLAEIGGFLKNQGERLPEHSEWRTPILTTALAFAKGDPGLVLPVEPSRGQALETVADACGWARLYLAADDPWLSDLARIEADVRNAASDGAKPTMGLRRAWAWVRNRWVGLRGGAA